MNIIPILKPIFIPLTTALALTAVIFTAKGTKTYLSTAQTPTLHLALALQAAAFSSATFLSALYIPQTPFMPLVTWLIFVSLIITYAIMNKITYRRISITISLLNTENLHPEIAHNLFISQQTFGTNLPNTTNLKIHSLYYKNLQQLASVSLPPTTAPELLSHQQHLRHTTIIRKHLITQFITFILEAATIILAIPLY